MTETLCRGLAVSELQNQFDASRMRAFAIIAAGILLNLGLFFILFLFAPLLVGIVCGYILGHRRNGVLAGFSSSLFSYTLMFYATGLEGGPVEFITAVLIMCIIGAVGGLFGHSLHKRMVDSSSQVSTTIRPGE